MSIRFLLLATSLIAATVVVRPGRAGEPSRRLTRAALEDKIRGGWAGQMIGVAYGAPTEFHSKGRTYDDPLSWAPNRIENAIHQDDLYVEMTFTEVMDRVGLGATPEQYGEALRDSEYPLWHANAGARRNLALGILPPLSGLPAYNSHADDIDFQIESDFLGLMTPGLPQEASHYAERVGRVMNSGDGLYGGMFFAGMYSAAFFETDVRRVVEEGLRSIPPQSAYARLIADVLRWSTQYPDDWRRTWQLIEERWNRDDVCPEGAYEPFNIDAKLNGGYVVLGLLYGRGDYPRTLEVSTRAGQDSDCNPSSAIGILGVMTGLSRIPKTYTADLPRIADTKFDHTGYSYNDIVRSTVARALTVIRSAGGTVSDDDVVIPFQEPKAPSLEQWAFGVPIRRIDFTDAAWSFKGGWHTETLKNDWSTWQTKVAGGPGDQASVPFEGTGFALAGLMSQEGGRADVFVDGKNVGIAEAWLPPNTNDNDLFRLFDLPAGGHTLRIVVRADALPRSKGKAITIDRLLVYGKR